MLLLSSQQLHKIRLGSKCQGFSRHKFLTIIRKCNLCQSDKCERGLQRIFIYRMMYTQNEKIPIAEFVKSDPLTRENMVLEQIKNTAKMKN